MKIAFFYNNNKELEFFKNNLKDYDVTFFKGCINGVNIDEILDASIISINAASKMPGELLCKLPNLKMIATRCTGIDHIDIEYCSSHNITVKNVPFYGENTIAEYVFALLLCLSRKIIESKQRVLDGSFNSSGLEGFDLKGKTIGIIGSGHIGLHTAKISKGFDMKVIVYDINRNDNLAKEIGFEYVDMDTLLKNSDIISLHVPYNKYTHHLINKDSFNKMKNGVVIINTARGAVIETESLIEALESKKVLAAGLDVLEGEDYLKSLYNNFNDDEKNTILENKNKLLNFDNVIITPHNAFNTKEAKDRINRTSVNNIIEFLRKC